jgi:hypothetical protein
MRPPLPLDPGPATALPWLLAKDFGGSLGAHPYLLPFFSTQIEFLNSIFRNDINSRRSTRCCGTQEVEKDEEEAQAKKNSKPGKKRLHILLDDTKKAFDCWEDLPEL